MSEVIPLYGSQNSTYSQAVWNDTIGKRSFELSNHLGNVLTVISDKPIPVDDANDSDIDWFLADIRQSTDYSGFGVQLENRNLLLTGVGEDYRLGFNGMEEDDQIKGDGNSYDFGARMLDPRLGRWLTIDPLARKYPNMSPYNFVANSPILFVDPDGERIRFSKALEPNEKRCYKSEIRLLRNGSSTFNQMYKDLKKSRDVYTFSKTDEYGADHYDSDSKTVFVNFNQSPINEPVNITISHEVGHAWRELMGLSIQDTDSPYCDDLPSNLNPGSISNGSIEHQVFLIKRHAIEEFETTHIENIVRSELGVELREEYGDVRDYTASDWKYINDIKGQPTKNKRLDIRKERKLNVRKDSSHDYSSGKNNYDGLKERKRIASEINVNKLEDENKYK